jgi:archaellum component FlaF (FlaF/FlaG flagellin family)
VGVDVVVVTVIVLVNDGFPLAGLKLTKMPVAGWGEIVEERDTAWVVPLTSVTLTVAEVPPPCTTEPLVGLTLTEKSNGNAAKLAVSVIGEFIVMDAGFAVPVTLPVPVPDQDENAYPGFGVADMLTEEPELYHDPVAGEVVPEPEGDTSIVNWYWVVYVAITVVADDTEPEQPVLHAYIIPLAPLTVAS